MYIIEKQIKTINQISVYLIFKRIVVQLLR